MYKLSVKKYGKPYYTMSKKYDILNRLISDMAICNPDNVIYNQKTVNVFYCDYKYSCKYTLPIAQWEELNKRQYNAL